jgi:segregation and condensation protein B
MNIAEVKQIIEALLFTASEPLASENIVKILRTKQSEEISTKDVKLLIEDLMRDYVLHGIELKEVASGYRFQVKKDFADWVSLLWEDKPPRYSRAFLETLAIIAYKQPMTRAEIEDVRGVTVSSNIMKTLQDHGWVKIVGFKEVPGKPALYATTDKFLDHFNLKTLNELPALPELMDLDKLGEQLQLDLQVEEEKKKEGGD